MGAYDDLFDSPNDEQWVQHAEWCATFFGNRACDCGGLEDACSVCGEVGPCSFDAEGMPLIHIGR